MKELQRAASLLFLLFPIFLAHGQNPVQHDWENEQVIGINKETARAHAILYPSVKEATDDASLHSPYLLDLNGTWNFNWVKHPDLRPVDFYKTEYDVSYWDQIEVPSNW